MALIEIQQKDEEVSTCILCGSDISLFEEEKEIRCDYCGKIGVAAVQCEENHCICTECNLLTPIEYTKQKCLAYKDTDPIALAVSIMNNPVIRMHGPEHHFIVPAVLLTCIANLKGETDELEDKLKIAELRSQSEAANNCTYNLGTCGAAIGTGVFLSIFTDQIPHTEDEWALSNTLIAESLKAISGLNLPRCCKRDTYISLETAANFLKDKYAIDLPMSEGKCTFSLRNKSCGHEQCMYYNISNSLV